MLRIGLSYAPGREPYVFYHRAVRLAAERAGVEVETIDLYADPSAAPSVDAIVFTGGPDVDPARYAQPEQRNRCEIDAARDAAEFALWDVVHARGIPVLGICRGLQLINVALGGSLIADIATKAAHTKRDGADARHSVETVSGSLIARLGGPHAEVNSSHHQAVDRLAGEMRVTSRAHDGTVESFEWAQPEGKPFLLAVQWHPERMAPADALSGPLFDRFLAEVSRVPAR